MSAKKILSYSLLVLMALASYMPVGWAQGVEPEPEQDMLLFFSNRVLTTTGNPLEVNCGTMRTYELTTPRVEPQGKAHLNRALAEANTLSTFSKCVTDFTYNVNASTSAFALEKGDLEVTFELGCELVAGAVQPVPLTSVEVTVFAKGNELGSDQTSLLLDAVCMQGAKIPIEAEIEIEDNETILGPSDQLTVRLDLRGANTEGAVLPYWYVHTNPNALVAFNVTEPPQCSDLADNDGDLLVDHPSDPGCTSPEDDDERDEDDDPPQCSDTLDNDGDNLIDFSADPGCTSAEDDDETDGGDNPECSDGVDNDQDTIVDHPADAGCTSPEDDDETDDTEPTGDAPDCARDDPAEPEVNRPVGQAFSLVAVCTDPDDDLATGEWTVDGQPVADEDLGASPAEVGEEFTFDEAGSHVIEITPTDEEGQEGAPASWVVHVTDDSGTGDAPSCARDDPSTFEITRAAGTPFTLRGVCTDADDDLDTGEWKVDDDTKTTDNLGDSPSTADEEFEIEDCGTVHIHLVPSDEAGNVGAAATWRVTVTGCSSPSPTPTDTSSPSPTETTPIPVFPSSLAFLLAAVGGVGGGFLILRRRA